MVSAARSKIDRQTAQLFDTEVDSVDHDKILTTLFQSDDRIRGMLCSLHGLSPLVQPGNEHSVQVSTYSSGYGYQPPTTRTIPMAEAVDLVGGPPPTWKTLDPIRDLKKKLEAPLYLPAERTSRILGFIDMLVSYWVPTKLSVVQASSGKHCWEVEKTHFHAFVEVKSKWPTAGNLLRQLNLYSECIADAQGTRRRIAIGPDAEMNELLFEHGWRLATFTPDLSKFQFCRKPSKAATSTPTAPNSF